MGKIFKISLLSEISYDFVYDKHTRDLDYLILIPCPRSKIKDL